VLDKKGSIEALVLSRISATIAVFFLSNSSAFLFFTDLEPFDFAAKLLPANKGLEIAFARTLS
jgi:hypothetical protein